MATVEDVQKLAALARIHIEDSHLEKFTKEFDAILDYVGQLEKLELPEAGKGEALPAGRQAPLRNIMREDGEPHEAGIHTEKLVAQFPAKKGNALAVKQIITHE